jgi:transcriptional regulator with XRE-family HTH domain
MFLSDYLEKNGISQRSFALSCGLSPAAISRIINRQRFPSPETMVIILEATQGQVDASDFFRQYNGVGERD